MILEKAFTLPIADVAVKLDTNIEIGLSNEIALERLRVYGLNQIPQQNPKKRWRIVLDQFWNPIILILVVAAFLTFMFNDPLEGFAIIIVILISTGIGFFMELQAVRSLEALRKMGQNSISVIRSGQESKTKASEVVPGDIIVLRPGDMVPADARVIETENLSVKESALTGESVPIFKETGTLPEGIPISDQNNMVFRGTMVVTGMGRALVTATAKHTQLGYIQQLGVEASKEGTPLEKKLNQLAKRLIWLTLFFVAAVVLAGFIRGRDVLPMIAIGVALAVAAIPEGLPIVATIALAQGMLRLSKKQIIIKTLEAVQTLGATDIICTDKTGTLTEDRMRVHSLLYGKHSVEYVNATENVHLRKKNPVFDTMIKASILCNNTDPASLESQGDSIELALMQFAIRLGYDAVSVKARYPEQLEVPFDSAHKLMATAHRYKEHFHVYVKGAFESLAEHCDMIMDAEGTTAFENKDAWRAKVDLMAAQGLRTLAFAHKETPTLPTKENMVQQLTFLGVMGFLDPARDDVKATIEIYKKAGIRVVMITGDHPGTSRKIAEEVGILERGANGTLVVHGKDLLQKLNKNRNDALTKTLGASVVARVTPEQKLALVSFYQSKGHIVGMIGDGINDVPALKKADIGIAMGIRGTEAAREAADVILKNDRFTAIELAIRQGRAILQNIRQFVIYLLSCNLAEIVSVGVAAFLNFPSPLLPLQILFLNLVTDVFPALALGLGKGERDIMERPPKNPSEPILNGRDWNITVLYGLCISLAVLGIVFYTDRVLGLPPETINNLAFYTLVLAQLLNIFNMPRPGESFFINEVTRNVWVWAAIVLSLGMTYGAYLITPVAMALSLQPVAFDGLVLTVLFALGSLFLAQMIKRTLLPRDTGMR